VTSRWWHHSGDADNAGLENVGPKCSCGKRRITRDLKVWKAWQNMSVLTMLSVNQRRKSTGIKSSGAESKTVSGVMVSRLCYVILLQRFCETCVNEVQRQGRGCPICRTTFRWYCVCSITCDKLTWMALLFHLLYLQFFCALSYVLTLILDRVISPKTLRTNTNLYLSICS